jgi:hypothetical protein
VEFLLLGLKIFGDGCQVWIGVFIEGVLGGKDLRKKVLNFDGMLGAVRFGGELMVEELDPCACIWVITRRRLAEIDGARCSTDMGRESWFFF